MKKDICHISKKEFWIQDLIHAQDIREAIILEIKRDYPDFSENSYIATEELYKYRKKHIENIVQIELGDATELEREVIEKLNNNKFIAGNVEPEMEQELTYGQRLADKIASFGGSWRFIIIFLLFIVCWIIINILFLNSKAFDPYPFILLNLILSCVAAIQAPVIMMSQNRQEEKDRSRSEHDYQVNLAAELQIRLLHEKVDHLMIKQHHQLLEIQEMQIELIEELTQKIELLSTKK